MGPLPPTTTSVGFAAIGSDGDDNGVALACRFDEHGCVDVWRSGRTGERPRHDLWEGALRGAKHEPVGPAAADRSALHRTQCSCSRRQRVGALLREHFFGMPSRRQVDRGRRLHRALGTPRCACACSPGFHPYRIGISARRRERVLRRSKPKRAPCRRSWEQFRSNARPGGRVLPIRGLAAIGSCAPRERQWGLLSRRRAVRESGRLTLRLAATRRLRAVQFRLSACRLPTVFE